MEPELEHRLYSLSKETLVLLLKELAARHASVSLEMAAILDMLATAAAPTIQGQDTVAAFHPDQLVMRSSSMPLASSPPDLAVRQQQLAGYIARLQQGEAPQAIFDDLVSLLLEAEASADQKDYSQALALYALALDAYLETEDPTLQAIFERAIDEFMPVLDMHLNEASSLLVPDTTYIASSVHPSPALSSLLTVDQRHQWLKRLFSLWLMRIDSHHAENDLPEIILEIAWSEDVPFLRQLVEHESRDAPSIEHTNIVDFSRQSRTRILEKFLQELPPV